MSEPEKPPTLDYARPARSERASRQRTNYCVGLPLLGIGLGIALGRGDEQLIAAGFLAVGGFFLGMALPVQE